jgi:hypothetical protein
MERERKRASERASERERERERETSSSSSRQAGWKGVKEAMYVRGVMLDPGRRCGGM